MHHKPRRISVRFTFYFLNVLKCLNTNIFMWMHVCLSYLVCWQTVPSTHVSSQPEVWNYCLLSKNLRENHAISLKKLLELEVCLFFNFQLFSSYLLVFQSISSIIPKYYEYMVFKTSHYIFLSSKHIKLVHLSIGRTHNWAILISLKLQKERP